jgi:hypothetical protein
MNFIAIIEPQDADQDAYAYKITATDADEAYDTIRKENSLDEISIIPEDEADGDTSDLPLWK